MRGIVAALLCLMWVSPTFASMQQKLESNQKMKRKAYADRMVLVLKVNQEVKSKEDLLKNLPADLVQNLQIDSLELLFTKASIPLGFEAWVSYTLKPEDESNGSDTDCLLYTSPSPRD